MARSLPLSDLAYQSARGNEAEVLRLLSRVDVARPGEGSVFCNDSDSRSLLATQRLARRRSQAEVGR